MTKNYFQGNSKHPQHISVGAIVFNSKGEVCCHHFNNEKMKDIKGYWFTEGLGDFYILMRETVNPGETLEQALARGLMEEFGTKAEIVDYAGSIKSKFFHEEVEVEKTTLYFLCKLLSQDFSKRHGDIESKSIVEWHKPDFLIPLMKDQAIKFGRTDVDESSILERIKDRGND